MRFDSFIASDIDPFLQIAGEEGWLSDRWEFDFVMNQFPQGGVVVRGASGNPVAFITAMAYGSSGWIGNLLVRKELRGNGIGSLLMDRALKALTSAGVRTIWLTASAAGAPLYKRLGFIGIDLVRRWRIHRTFNDKPHLFHSTDKLVAVDCQGWGDERSLLCTEKVRLGKMINHDSSWMVINRFEQFSTIGPWVAGATADAEKHLQNSISGSEASGVSYVDLPAGNRKANRVLETSGFSSVGETLLMYRGKPPEYHPELIFALATLGSLG